VKIYLNLAERNSFLLIITSLVCFVFSSLQAQATPDSKIKISETSFETSNLNSSIDEGLLNSGEIGISTPPLEQSEILLSNPKMVDNFTEEANTITEEDSTEKTQFQTPFLPTDTANETLTPATQPLDSIETIEGDDPMSQMTNVTQLSDVQPSDWAYEALRSLVERYGCIAGYPDGTFRGNRSMTRYEFAAGLSACLQQIERLISTRGTDLTSKQDLEILRRLVSEFQTEITTIGTQVDQLETRTSQLENNQFSTTTKLFGQVIFGVQGRSENEFDFGPFNRQDLGTAVRDEGTNINLIDNVQLSLFSQFSPRSLLLTGLSAGNGNNNAVRLANYVALGYESGTDNNLQISDLNFRHLIGSRLALIVGPVGVNPVDVFRGVNRVESAGSGPLSQFAQRNPIINIGGRGGGIGFDWQVATRVSLQAVYSANRTEDPINGGIFGGENGTSTVGAQLVVSPTNNIDISFQYINSYSPFGTLVPGNNNGSGDNLLVIQNIDTGRAPIQTNAFGISLEWRVAPRFTIGGWGGYTTSDFRGGSGSVETINWMGFLNFPDLLGQGNLAGIYVGQPPKITSSDVSSDGVGRNVPSFVNRGNLAATEGGQPDTTIHLEGFYRIRVTDNISLTPGIIVIFNPNHNENNDTITIGALRTTFTF
jgi:hypothetical protein